MSISNIFILAAVQITSIARFRENLSKEPTFKVTMVTSEIAAREILNNPDKRIDVLVVDNALGKVFEFIKELRDSNPRLNIILVDEEADFGMPGRADDVTTEPFNNDDLIKRIKRLVEDRRLETLSADSLPHVRNFAKSLRKATKGQGKQQAAVSAVQELGYDYVAYYSIAPTDPPSLTLSAQIGPNAIMSIVPTHSDYTGLLGTVAQSGQMKIVGPNDQPNHILVEKGKFGAAVCVPVGTALRFGVMLACREQPGTIKPENILMLELVCKQLSASLAKDQRG